MSRDGAITAIVCLLDQSRAVSVQPVLYAPPGRLKLFSNTWPLFIERNATPSDRRWGSDGGEHTARSMDTASQPGPRHAAWPFTSMVVFFRFVLQPDHQPCWCVGAAYQDPTKSGADRCSSGLGVLCVHCPAGMGAGVGVRAFGGDARPQLRSAAMVCPAGDVRCARRRDGAAALPAWGAEAAACNLAWPLAAEQRQPGCCGSAPPR